MLPKIKLSRVENFNAAHRLHNPHWSDEKNKEFFGLCNNPNYHGHNYKLIVSIMGEKDEDSGYVLNLSHLKKIIQENIINRFDHKNLNLDCSEFANLNPTTENFAIVIYQLLKPLIHKNLDLQIQLFETPKNFVTYPI